MTPNAEVLENKSIQDNTLLGTFFPDHHFWVYLLCHSGPAEIVVW